MILVSPAEMLIFNCLEQSRDLLQLSRSLGSPFAHVEAVVERLERKGLVVRGGNWRFRQAPKASPIVRLPTLGAL